MSTAKKGRAFEHEVRELFRAAGYCVIRGAGSKGELAGAGKVDLVATRLTAQTEYKVFLTVIGAQCKVKKRRKSVDSGTAKHVDSTAKEPSE